jgi:hypothetical protein
MSHDFIRLIVATAVAFIITVLIGFGRQKGWRAFSHWWDGEGLPIFIIAWLLIYILFVEWR